MFDKLKQMVELKKQAEQIKRELEAATVEVAETSGIRIVIDGVQHFREIEIDSALLAPENKTAFERDLLRSLNGAVKKSQDIGAQKMRQAAGFSVPGF